MDNVEKVALTMVAAIICAALLVGTALVLNGALLLGGPRGDRRFKQGGTRGKTMIKIEAASALSRLKRGFPVPKGRSILDC